MNIGIVGAGQVGQSLARGLTAHGHAVMLSSRTPDSAEMQQLAQTLGVQVGTVAATVAFGPVVAIALRWDAVPDVAGQADWQGKIVIDMMNRFGGASPRSAAQDLAALLPGAQVVKAFNTIGAEHYPAPDFSGQAASMLIAGDSAAAKQTVGQLITELGFDVVDAGDLSAAVHLENLGALWVHLAFRAGQGRDIAFKLVRK